MVRILIGILFFLFGLTLKGQVRNGWRSIYDKEGRLTRMYFYDNGMQIKDSTFLFQYHTDNVLKGLVTGEVDARSGNIDGTIGLFDYAGMLTTYHIKKQGNVVFDVDVDFDRKCTAVWSDLFDVNTHQWICDSSSVSNSNLIIHNTQNSSSAIFNPDVDLNLENDFACKLIVPIEGNSAKQGLALGYKDENNYYLFEISYGKYYTVQYWEDGVLTTVTNGRQEIERPAVDANEIVIKKIKQNLIFELNGSIEMVLPTPNFKGDKVALVTRSRGNAHFADFILRCNLPEGDPFYKSLWVGKGSGLYISTTGKIITTYDAIAGSNNIRVSGEINGKIYKQPATVVMTEEENNLAILQLNDRSFKLFDELPYGITDHIPVSESKVFSLGYPNAISGIFMEPEVFEGKVLPSSASYSSNRLLEMSFRYGMLGSPVFDKDANFIGICAFKGLDLNYTEIIDFYDNSRLFKANMGLSESRIESPNKDKTMQEKIKALSESVVIIESSVFKFEPERVKRVRP